MHTEIIHVLLADDDDDDRLFFREAFEELKLKTQLKTAIDGVDLLEYLSQPDAVLPHVLFLDLNMPRKGGMDCLREIKSDHRYKDIAIAIYSTSASEEDIEEAFVKGANVYIKKPSDFEELKKVLAKVITINWQYHTSGLNRDAFMLSL